jgi:hypothetical protein
VHQATVQRHVKMNQEIQIKPSNMCFSLNLLYNCEKMQLTDEVCQKHRPLVFLAGLLLVKVI